MYIKRKITPIIYELLEDFRIVSINGEIQSGKTTLSKEGINLNGFYTFLMRGCCKGEPKCSPLNSICNKGRKKNISIIG